MKKLFLLLLTLVPFFAISQSLNDYKYAIIPAKFEFSAEPNEFNINTFTKMYLEKYGFEAYSEGEKFPADFASSRCNKVYVDVIKKRNLFTTILFIEVKDCQNNVLYTSQEGRSKEKAYAKSFPQALREAFSSFDNLNHSYNGTVHNDTEASKTANNSLAQTAVVVSESKTENKVTTEKPMVTANAKPATLFAQPIANGYQIINAEPKVIMKIYFTSVSNVYLAEKDNLKGMLNNKNGGWYFEYLENGKLISEKVDVNL